VATSFFIFFLASEPVVICLNSTKSQIYGVGACFTFFEQIHSGVVGVERVWLEKIGAEFFSDLELHEVVPNTP
jgi:hypothetical protein